jgi:hypothetical protein
MIPFLILTAHTIRQMQEDLRELGVGAVLNMPISAGEFLTVIAYFFETKCRHYLAERANP